MFLPASAWLHKFYVMCVVMDQWTEGGHARIAAAIRAVRGNRSAQWLADRTAELGHPVTRAQITNYENGRKASLDVADLIVIAAALGTSPVCLVYPGPYGERIPHLPGMDASQFEAAQWFSGEMWISGVGDDWTDSTEQLRYSRLLAEVELARKRAVFRHVKAGRPPEQAADLDAELALYDRQIREFRSRLGTTEDA